MAPCEVTEDYYAVLDVPHNATVDSVRPNYRRLAKALGDEQCSDKMDILPEKRWPHVALLPSFGSSFCIEPSGVMAV